jgi:uncharacterized protein
MHLTYHSSKTEVRLSPIHGKGLFAKTDINAGEIVAMKGGYIFTRSQWRNVQSTLSPAEIPIAEDLFIAPSNPNEFNGSMVYSNHSCDPNVAVQGQIAFVAMRDIRSGEELTHDWATTDDDEHEMQCRCGSPECRRVVTGKDWMKPELQAKYAGWFCWYLQRKIDGLQRRQERPNRSLHRPPGSAFGKQ